MTPEEPSTDKRPPLCAIYLTRQCDIWVKSTGCDGRNDTEKM